MTSYGGATRAPGEAASRVARPAREAPESRAPIAAIACRVARCHGRPAGIAAPVGRGRGGFRRQAALIDAPHRALFAFLLARQHPVTRENAVGHPRLAIGVAALRARRRHRLEHLPPGEHRSEAPPPRRSPSDRNRQSYLPAPWYGHDAPGSAGGAPPRPETAGRDAPGRRRQHTRGGRSGDEHPLARQGRDPLVGGRIPRKLSGSAADACAGPPGARRRTARSSETASGSAYCSPSKPATKRPPRTSPRASSVRSTRSQIAPRQRLLLARDACCGRPRPCGASSWRATNSTGGGVELSCRSRLQRPATGARMLRRDAGTSSERSPPIGVAGHEPARHQLAEPIFELGRQEPRWRGRAPAETSPRARRAVVDLARRARPAR